MNLGDKNFYDSVFFKKRKQYLYNFKEDLKNKSL